MRLDDLPKHKGQRAKLVRELREKGISDEAVLSAIGKIPRHLFYLQNDSALDEIAYTDRAFKIGADQTISHPFTVAFQSQLLDVKKGEKVLEIGTGSGYQTSVLLELGAKVFSIERIKLLFDRTIQFLPKLGYQAKLFYGDGFKGLPTFAPFDKIIVTAGAPIIPEALKTQLKIGGLMVIPVGEGSQVMTTVLKKSATEFEIIELMDFSFVPMLEQKTL